MTVRSYHVLLLVVLVFAFCAMIACGAPPLPTAERRAEVTPTVTEIPATATPIPPTQTPSPTPTPTPSFTQDGLRYMTLAEAGENAYSPVMVAADPGLQQIYVYSSYNNDDGQDTLSVIQADTQEIIKTIRLGGSQTIPSLASELLVDPISHRIYALNGDSRALLILDGETQDILFIIHGAIHVALAPEQDRVYLINEIGQIKVLSATDYASLRNLDWEHNFEASFIAYNAANDRLYLARWDFVHGGGVVILDGTTLEKQGDLPLPSAPHALEVDPARNEIYVATNTGVTVIDGATDSIVDNVNLAIDSFNPTRSMALVPQKDRLYLSYNWGLARATGGGLIILDTKTRKILGRVKTQHFWQDILYVPEYDALYATPSGNESLLVIAEDGHVQKRTMLGLRLLDMQVDPKTDYLWVVDSTGTIHVHANDPQMTELQRVEGVIGTVDGAVEVADLVLTEHGAYVTDEAKERTVSLDTETMELRQKFKAAGPIAVDTRGQRLFVVDGNIAIYGLGTGKPLSHIQVSPSGDESQAIGISYESSADGIFLQIRNDVNSSANYRTYWRLYNSQTGRYSTVFNPDKRDVTGIAAMPDARRVYLTYAGSSEWDQGMIVYDAGGVELERIKGLSGLVSASPDGTYLYLLRPSGLWVLERDSLRLSALWPLTESYEQVALDTTGHSIYLRRESQIAHVSVEELMDKGIQSPRLLPESLGLPASTYRSPQYAEDATIYALVPGEGIYRSENGGATWQINISGLKDLYVTELTFSDSFGDDGTIWIRTASREAYRSSDRGQTWRRASAWTPVVAFVSTQDGKPGIFLMNGDASQTRRLTAEGIDAQNPHWSSDGNWICFDSQHEGNPEIYVIQADGYGLARLTSDPADDTQPAWSPVGDQIAFVSTRDGNPELYLMDADGDNQTRLTDNAARDEHPRWSPDGRQLVFASDRDGQDEIYVLTLATGETTRVTTDEARDSQPAWSPDGQWLAFVSDRHGDADIFIVHPDGSELSQVTQASATEDSPAWSPDSQSLIIASNRTGAFQLYRLNRYGGNWVRLTLDAHTNTNPAWLAK